MTFNINDTDDFCIKCKYIFSCTYPCEEFSDYKFEKALVNGYKSMENIKESGSKMSVNDINTYDCTDIQDFMECGVGDPLHLQIVNGLVSPIQAIDFVKIRQYMIEKNEEYAKDYGLCETCHSELVDYDNNSEHFGRVVSEKELRCLRCG